MARTPDLNKPRLDPRLALIKGRHAQDPPASGRAHQRGEQPLIADDARQVLYDIIKRVTLVVEQALAFPGIQPVGGVWLATEGTFRPHADAHHLQHASKVVPVQDLATGAAPDEQNPTPSLLGAHAIANRQPRTIASAISEPV